jgi:hypothetical protein
MAPVQTARLNNIVWKLHEQRGRNAELIEVRRRYLEKAYCAQIRSDKHLLLSHIARMQPSVQRAFLQARLQKLREREKEIRTPVSDE